MLLDKFSPMTGAAKVGTARLEETVAAHREALMERTRDRVPFELG
jgi:hypothetical protein